MVRTHRCLANGIFIHELLLITSYAAVDVLCLGLGPIGINIVRFSSCRRTADCDWYTPNEALVRGLQRSLCDQGSQ